MDVRTMRRVDRWIGAPLCAALSVFRRVDDLILRRDRPSAPRRIAVLKLAEQGATVLAYPALQRAAEMVGAENLFFVVFEENRFILDLLQVVPDDNVIVIRSDGLVRVVADTLRAILRMHREHIDATVDFEFFARSTAILAYLSGARTRVGYHASFGEASYRGDLMTHRLSLNPFLHASEMFQVLVEAVGMPAEDFPACSLRPPGDTELPMLEATAEEVEEVERVVCERLGVERRPVLVLLNANCGDMLPLRRWPIERYVEVARRLLERFPELSILLTGAPEERADAEALAAEIGSERCVSMAGHTTLRQLLVLYGLAELMVTNDSGPAHYASLTPIDVITLFGPETPAVFGARTPRSHLLWTGLVCSPCVNAFNDRQSACHHNICMEQIMADEVVEIACRVIENRRSAGGDRAVPAELGEGLEVRG
jgi:ADP-heptose:LPS heptosyltransferase